MKKILISSCMVLLSFVSLHSAQAKSCPATYRQGVLHSVLYRSLSQAQAEGNNGGILCHYQGCNNGGSCYKVYRDYVNDVGPAWQFMDETPEMVCAKSQNNLGEMQDPSACSFSQLKDVVE